MRRPGQTLSAVCPVIDCIYNFLESRGGVVGGGRRCLLPCSYPYTISISTFSDQGLPRNSMPTGTPDAAVGVDEENPPGTTMEGKPARLTFVGPRPLHLQ